MNIVRFDEQEFLHRISVCQTRLGEQNFSGMMVSAEANINYYSGYRTHAPWTTFTRPMFLFIPASGRPLLYTQTFVTTEARLRSHGCDHRNFSSLLGPTAQDLALIMEELGMYKGKIGLELGFEQRINYQPDTLISLKEKLPDAIFADASDIIWSQRLIKSSTEI